MYSAWSDTSNLGIAEALRRAAERGDITYIGIRHEGAASFAASAYGKLTGRPAATASRHTHGRPCANEVGLGGTGGFRPAVPSAPPNA